MSGRAAPPFRGAMALGKIAAQRDIALSRLFLTFGTDTAHCSLAAQASKTTGWPALQSWTDALSTKSASTLVARSLALARYAEFCQQHDVPLLPFDEVLVYKFLLSHAPSSPSTAATLWTAIRFAIHMLGCAHSEDLVHSKRICGLVERKMVDRPPRSQEPPLTVAAIARLETFWLSKKEVWLALAGFWLGFWLASGWLSGWFGAIKKEVWLACWLAFWLASGWLAGFLAGFLAGLAGFLAGFWLAFWLAWLVWTIFLARLAETQLRGKLQAYLGVFYSYRKQFIRLKPICAMISELSERIWGSLETCWPFGCPSSPRSASSSC